jgi:hypothetical protein
MARPSRCWPDAGGRRHILLRLARMLTEAMLKAVLPALSVPQAEWARPAQPDPASNMPMESAPPIRSADCTVIESQTQSAPRTRQMRANTNGHRIANRWICLMIRCVPDLRANNSRTCSTSPEFWILPYRSAHWVTTMKMAAPALPTIQSQTVNHVARIDGFTLAYLALSVTLALRAALRSSGRRDEGLTCGLLAESST